MKNKSSNKAVWFFALLLTSSIFGIAAFLVGRAMYGEYIQKKSCTAKQGGRS